MNMIPIQTTLTQQKPCLDFNQSMYSHIISGLYLNEQVLRVGAINKPHFSFSFFTNLSIPIAATFNCSLFPNFFH